MAKNATVDMTIDASPTKELFIAMLTRDVALIPAISDSPIDAESVLMVIRKTIGDPDQKGANRDVQDQD